MFNYAINCLKLKRDRRAVTALEYGLIAGVIVAVIASGFSYAATNLGDYFAGIGVCLVDSCQEADSGHMDLINLGKSQGGGP
jgi:Flp pilus assembly pilin Flp